MAVGTLNAKQEVTWKRNEAGQAAPRTLEQYAPLMHKIAGKATRRAEAAGVLLEYEDIYQELQIQFIKTLETYREDGGRSFMNYFIHGSWQLIETLFRPDKRRLKHAITISGDTTRCADDGPGAPWNHIADDAPTPEQLIEAQWLIDHIRSQLSPMACQLFDLAVDPPDEVIRQLDAANAAIMMDRGSNFPEETIRSIRYGRIDFHFLGCLYGIERAHAQRARLEVEGVVQAIYKKLESAQ